MKMMRERCLHTAEGVEGRRLPGAREMVMMVGIDDEWRGRECVVGR